MAKRNVQRTYAVGKRITARNKISRSLRLRVSIHHVAAPNFLPNFSPCLQLPLASDKHGCRRLERAQPPRKSSGNSWRNMEEETRRVGPTPTAERGSIAFRCKKAQPRTPAIVVLLIGHRNRSGKTHKLDQLVVDWVSKSDWSGQTAALR